MSISLTELRQRLFQLADRVVQTGEPLVVVRNGVRLRLVRDEDTPSAEGGRLAKLTRQDAVIGAPLDPHESPAAWSESLVWARSKPLRVAEPAVEFGVSTPKPERRKK